MPNITDANFNKNYLTAKSSDEQDLAHRHYLILIVAAKLKNSEIISEKHVHSNMNLRSNAVSSSRQVIAKQTGTVKSSSSQGILR